MNTDSLKQWGPWNSQILTKQQSTTTKNYFVVVEGATPWIKLLFYCAYKHTHVRHADL